MFQIMCTRLDGIRSETFVFRGVVFETAEQAKQMITTNPFRAKPLPDAPDTYYDVLGSGNYISIYRIIKVYMTGEEPKALILDKDKVFIT